MRSTRTIIFSLVVCALTTHAARSQSVPYERFVLENGMTVILHEDHRLPLVTINTWFYVGAKDEPVGRSGFAHLFEHLMFMGTDRVPEGQFDGIMEGKGGANNASTDFDRTNYYSWGPAEMLPTLLWLDADRLEGLAAAMTQEKLDLQRAVVRNERRQTSENMPYGRAQLAMVDFLYPEGHPYHDDVIGSHADLEAGTVDDVKEFFVNFYVPNNASLVVAGDFDPAAIREMVEDLFGTIPAGPEPTRRAASVPVLHGETRKTMLDRVQLPMIKYGWISPVAFADGDAEMTVIAGLLTNEGTGRLYRRLVVDEQLAVQVSAYQQSLVLGSSFLLDVVCRGGADLDRVEAIVDEEIARLAGFGPSVDELERLRAAREREDLEGLFALSEKADRLNEYQFFLGEPDSFARDARRFAAVTPAGVSRFAGRVLDRDRVVIRVLPENSEPAASPRDTQPPDVTVASFQVPAPERFVLENGVGVVLYSRRDLPLVEVGLAFHDGTQMVSPERLGAGQVLADLMKEGAGERDSVAFSDALEGLGASVDVSAGRHGFEVHLSSLVRNIGPAMDLLADVVLRPTLGEPDFARIKNQALDALRQESDRPTSVGLRVGRELLYGKDSPWGTPASGSEESVTQLRRADVVSLHQQWFHPARAAFVVAGDLSAAEARELLSIRFAKWTGATQAAKSALPADVYAPAPEGLRVALVDRPGAVQTAVGFMLPGIVRTDESNVRYRMLSTILGGSFTSRLNTNLREDKGYTYGASCRYDLPLHAPMFLVFSSVRADVTGPALKEFLFEIEKIRTGDVSEAEVLKARSTLRTAAVESIQSLSDLVSATLAKQETHEGLDAIQRELNAMMKVTAADLNAAARTAIPLEKGVLVLVGDAATILPQLEGLGLPEPIRLDPRSL